MKRKPSLSSLKRKLDKQFSLFIRRRDTVQDGMGVCITCCTVARLQAGHFIKRQHLATRWDERNVHGQCPRCNLWLHGNEGEYCNILIKRYGQDVVDELMRLKRTTVKMTREDYNTLIERYS